MRDGSLQVVSKDSTQSYQGLDQYSEGAELRAPVEVGRLCRFKLKGFLGDENFRGKRQRGCLIVVAAVRCKMW